jgi:iron complex transport system ATP-binding protein
MNEVVKIESLSIGYRKGYNRRVLHNSLNSSAGAGELVVVIGRNGAGKSTLLKTIAGIIPPLEGSVNIKGKNIKAFSRYQMARTSGYISTEKIHVDNLRVAELVALGRFPYTDWTGRLDAESIRIINESISSTGIEHLRDRYVSELSDGERQRAMIARVLAQNTEIMLLDEPFAFLDLTSRYELLHLLVKLARDGKAVILTSHDYEIALNHSDKLWILDQRGLSEGSPEDLLIRGIPEQLFESDAGSFDPVNTIFRMHPSGSGSVYISGESPLKNWILKAFRRAGFTESVSMTDPYLEIVPGTETIFRIVINGKKEEHNTIYSLINSLHSLLKNPS